MGVPTSKRDFRRLATKRPSISREVLTEVLSSIRATPGFYASRRRTVPFPRRKMKTISIFAVLQSKCYFPNEDRVGKSIFLISYKKTLVHCLSVAFIGATASLTRVREFPFLDR